MNIITKEEQKGRLEDGIQTLLHLDEESFETVIAQLNSKEKQLSELKMYYTTDGSEAPHNPIQLGLERMTDEQGNRISRYYYHLEEHPTTNQILNALESKMEMYTPDSPEYSRIKALLDARGLDGFKTRYLAEDGSNVHILNNIFEILSNEETFKRFMDYQNNIQYFSVEGRETKISEYFKYLAELFGKKDNDGNLQYNVLASRDFYIPGLDGYQKRYLQILANMNMERYVNPDYEFKSNPTYTIRKDEEPDWTISPEIYREVYSGMSEGLSLEEQAMYIYCKLCQIFLYDEGYMYRDKITKVNYESTFSKEHLEGIKPGTKITCYDFSRIFAKLINEIEGDIEAVVLIEGWNEGHFRAGFYTDKVSAEVEPVNVDVNGSNDPTNDLMKAKNGIKLRGIKTISDEEGVLKKAMEVVYPQVLGKQPISIKEYVEKLKQMPREDIPNDVQTKLESFLEVMRTNNISGNELAQALAGLRRSKFLKGQLDCAYLGEIEENNGQKRYRRKILLRQTQTDSQEKQEKPIMYLLDPESLELAMCLDEEIISKLNSGEFVYENEKRKMPGIDREVE